MSGCLVSAGAESEVDPLGIVESFAATEGWPYERRDDELTAVLGGAVVDYSLGVQWDSFAEVMNFVLEFPVKVPTLAQQRVQRLVVLANTRLVVGGFDLSSSDGVLRLRYPLVLAGGCTLAGRQCEAVVQYLNKGADTFFPAFQSVIWAGRLPEEALRAALFETVGEA